MHPKRYFIRTFGCQMNEHDSEKIAFMLEEQGYAPAEGFFDADLVIFNTCTIREKAHHKAMSEIGRTRLLKEQRPGALVGICGCVAQQEGKALFERFPAVDLLFGPDQIAALPQLLDEARQGGKIHALDLINDPAHYRFLESASAFGRSQGSAFVLAIKGCQCACSYCIVPSVRGKEISRPAQEIVEEIRALAASGVKEIVLLGQNVSSYGRSPTVRRPGEGLAKLIDQIARETEIERIRFVSPHPKDIGEDLIDAYAQQKKLCPHIHLPVQSGSTSLLKRMRRGYTRDHYIALTEALRRARPEIAITTDIIVGFCGERDVDYQDTLDLMRTVRFDQAFAFQYSPRPGTEAARDFEDDVPFKEKGRRLEELLRLQRLISREKNEAKIGTTGHALVLGTDRLERGFLTGRLQDNRIVHFAGHSDCLGHIVPIRIAGAHDNSLQGEMLV